MDGFGWIIVVLALVLVAWAIFKRLFRLALLGGVLIVGLIAGWYFVTQ